MGFPSSYTVFLPKLFVHAVSFLYLVKALFLSFFHSLGLSGLLDTCPERELFVSGPDDPTRILLSRFAPLSALVIREHLPLVQFSDAVAALKSAGGGLAEAAETCAVCLCEFEGGEEVRWLSNCKHIFHRICLDRWIDHNQRTCPLCRAQLLGDDLTEELNQRLLFVDQYYYYHDDFDDDDGGDN